MSSPIRIFQDLKIFQPLRILFIIIFLIKFTIIDLSVMVSGTLLVPPNSTTKIEINDTDEEVAFFATEIKKFLGQDNLTEEEIGIITHKDDLIYVDMGHVNISRKKVTVDNKVQNEEISNLTTKMIDDDNKAIIEMDKRIPLENEPGLEITTITPASVMGKATRKATTNALNEPTKTTVSKQSNDDLIVVRAGQNSQTITDLVVDDDCSSEEKSEQYIASMLKNRREQFLRASQKNLTEIDFNDFIELIPADDVREIFHYYYRNDKEVQRAYTYLMSKDFLHLKDKILAVTEVNIFVKYLKKFGLDIIQLLQTIVKLVGDPIESDLQQNRNLIDNKTETSIIVKEINNQVENVTTVISIENDEIQNSTTVIEYGLHGLIDSILDILPQDQIISLFFEKLETDYEFSNLVNHIGDDEFSRILKRMESSVELKHLIYTLHNNGIYVDRIVDSLKGYFFLGF